MNRFSYGRFAPRRWPAAPWISGLLAVLAIGNCAYGQSSRSRRNSGPSPPPIAAPRVVDEARARAAGIRKLESKHLVLYTNVKSKPDVDNLPAVFDLAVPQWAEYFGIDQEKTRNWQAQGFLISGRDVEPFASLGLMPTGNEEFPHGISMGREFWLYAQPSEYYQRHLVLHEGTHTFMVSFLGSCGPGWYMEGTAELFGTHRYDDRYKQLTLRTMPADRDEVPMWGRILLVHGIVSDRAPPLASLFEFGKREDFVGPFTDSRYALCWAAAKFLDSHPRYRARFRKLRNHVTDPDFNERFRELYRGQWAEMQAEWLAYIATLDYGYDYERMAVDFRRGRPLTVPVTAEIAADRGWQSSGVRLEAGKTYRVNAKGRYVIANDGQPWSCEPGGVTIDYHNGRPLGMLLGAIDGTKSGATLADAFPVGLETTFKPTASGTLYLRVNDSPAKLDDNRGTLAATISPSG